MHGCEIVCYAGSHILEFVFAFNRVGINERPLSLLSLHIVVFVEINKTAPDRVDTIQSSNLFQFLFKQKSSFARRRACRSTKGENLRENLQS